jgi:hypothetical protein
VVVVVVVGGVVMKEGGECVIERVHVWRYCSTAVVAKFKQGSAMLNSAVGCSTALPCYSEPIYMLKRKKERKACRH